MADDSATRVATDAVEAFNSADWSRFRELLAADIVYEETGTQRRVSGRDAYVELCQGWKQAFPDARGTIHRSVASGDTSVQEITWTGTRERELSSASRTRTGLWSQEAALASLESRPGRALATPLLSAGYVLDA
jgi:ketosteroid isomerase-like protein